MVVYAGKSMRQFGKGISDILNKEVTTSDALEEGFVADYFGNDRNTIVLDID